MYYEGHSKEVKTDPLKKRNIRKQMCSQILKSIVYTKHKENVLQVRREECCKQISGMYRGDECTQDREKDYVICLQRKKVLVSTKLIKRIKFKKLYGGYAEQTINQIYHVLKRRMNKWTRSYRAASDGSHEFKIHGFRN